MTKEGSTSHGNWPHPLSVGTWELAELYLYDEMAFRSGYCRVQSASIITEKKHFPFKQRNQQPCTTRPEKKKLSNHKTNKYSAGFQEVWRGSNKTVSIEVVREHLCLLQPQFLFMLLAFIHRPQEGIPTSGYSQIIFRTGGPNISHPAWGRGSTHIWICFQTTALSLRPRDLKNWRQKFHRERERKLSRGVNRPMMRKPPLVQCERLFVEPEGRFPLRRGLSFSAGPWGGG